MFFITVYIGPKGVTLENRPIEVKPVAGSIGAEILNIDLTRKISTDVFEAIHGALLEHLVIFLPGQEKLEPKHLRNFAEQFGALDKDPFVFPFKIPPVDGFPEIYSNIKSAENAGFNIGGFWHADVTYRQKPHKASVLYAKEVPEYGGDTMFANQYLAYQTLSQEMKDKLETMQAVHSSAMPHAQTAARFLAVGREHVTVNENGKSGSTGFDDVDVEVLETIHPVIRAHPVTGKKLLYLNRGFTSHFVGMSVEDSLPLLQELWGHASRAEFACRYRWSTNDVAVWDNCATHHYAINDYRGQRRHMQRISIHED